MKRIIAAILCGAAGMASLAARADDFYAGKTITIVIGFGVGTGYDLYPRAVGRTMGKYLAGRPNVIAQNMPGAGSLQAISYLYNSAPKDGTTIGIIDQATPTSQIMGMPGLRADVTGFNWIGRMVSNTPVLFSWKSAKVQDIKDAFNDEMIVSASGQNSRMTSTLMRNLLGLKLKIVTGYPSSAESLLAMERREVDATTLPWPVLRAEKGDWIKDGTVRLLLQVGAEPNPDLKGKVPMLTDLARNDDEKAILAMMTQDSRVGRALLAPPGLPAERVAELRAAFMKTMTDADFLADIQRQQLDLSPMDGETLQALIKQSVATPADLVAKAKKLSTVEN